MKLKIVAILAILANSVFAQNYHDTQGKLEISGSGQATFNLPIAMPPSINNYGPKIDVNYASGQLSGIAGQGWNINGISKITRINTRLDIDGFIDGVDFDDNDKLALDGQRLIIKAGSYWAGGAIYQTEFQSNMKIQQIGSGTNISFLVTTPDGTKNWYGKYDTNIATDLTSYCLVRTEDTNGNFITYNYSRPLSASLCIDNIEFSMNTISNPTPQNKIHFHYEQAPIIEKSYINGAPIVKKVILKSIEVVTNMTFFRKYEFTYSTALDGYSRLIKFQEFNGNNEAANPIEFTYNQTNNDINVEYKKTNFSFNFEPSKIRFLGDFNGDNLTDALIDNTVVFNPFELNEENYQTSSIVGGKCFQGKTLRDNKLVQNNSIISVVENSSNLLLNVYNYQRNFNSNIANHYQKNILYDNISTCVDYCSEGNVGECEEIDEFGNVIIVPCNTNDCPINPSKKMSNQYVEGDFNGDGLSEVLILGFQDINRFAPLPSNNGRIVIPENPCVWVHEISKYPIKINIIDLRQSESTVEGTKGNVNIENTVLLGDGKRYVIDYNGDGKSDLLCFNDEGSSGFYRVIGFKQLLVAPWVELEVLGQGFIDKYSTSKQILFGDYNGDSKTDFMLPEGECNNIGEPSCSGWHVYYANPNPNNLNSFVKEIQNITSYNPLKQYSSGQTFQNYYYSIDANKDGKSDLVRVETWLRNVNEAFWPGFIGPEMWVYEYKTHVFINKLSNSSVNGFSLVNSTNYESMNKYNMPLVINQRNNGLESEFMMFSFRDLDASFTTNGVYASIDYINFNSNFQKNNQLSKVTQSEGKIIDDIYYSKLIGSSSKNHFGNGTDIYSSDNSLEFPLVEIKGFFNNEVVSKLTNNSAGLKRNKDYSYKGMCMDLQGVGFLGFRKTAQTSWYVDADTKKTWSVTEISPQKRGAVINSFSMFLTQPFNFDFSYTNLISNTFYKYDTSPVGVFPYYTLLKKETSIDFLTNINSEKDFVTYSPDYFLPVFVTNKKYNGTTLEAKTSTTTNYDIPIDNFNTYIIGKPNEIHSISEIYANTSSAYNVKFSNEKLSYINNRLSRTEKTSNGSTEKIVEVFNYFPNGLLQSKTLKAENTTSANAVSPRTTEYTYDSSNRFLKTVKAPDGLITTYNEYEPIYGLVKKETNPFGQSTLSLYDNWGKRTKVTDFLGISITYTYSKNNGVYKTTQVGDDGSNSFVEQDVLSREIKRGSIDINGNWNYVNTEYDQYGRKYRVSEPYNGFSSPSQWSKTEYDDYSRAIKQTAYTGKIVTTNYNGLTVTATEPAMSKSKTINALGLIISSTDTPGGTITYKYDANGNLLESDYEGIKTTMTYDKWNRKETYLDTSMGLLTYTYDAFGQVKSETTPKGITEITYTPSGQILTKSIIALIPGTTNPDVSNTTYNTHITSTYTYDSFFRISKINVVNLNDGNNLYEYFYDPTTKQLKKTIETLYSVGSTTPIVTFTKELTFDLFGRVDTETSTASAFSKSSTKTMKRTYKNGALWQLLDGATIKWQANTANARGQLTSLTLGNGINITNSYDNFGYLTQNKYDISTTNVMTFNTAFEPVLGNLTSRYNSLFDAKEEFKYDNLDRLISWDGGAQNILNLPFNTTTDGFTFTSTSTNGSVTNSAGTLKVVLKSPSDPDFPIAAQRNLALGLTNGNKIAIKATITNKTGTSGVIVNAVMVETDPTDPTNYVEYVVGTIQNGAFEANYTVSDFVANPTLKLRFVISGDSPDSSNGGGIVSPFSTFYLDNLKIDKIIVNTQNYDNRGRITQNNLGSYSYDVASNRPYQNKKINLNTDANVYYASRQIQDVTYNAFKGIIQIDQPNFDKISFGYNGMEERSIMYWGNTNTNKFARPYRRYYSVDGSMEIKAIFGAGNTTVPASVEFLTYLDGDAYSSNVILKSDGITQNYFYLHRDYQGSILAITNASGGLVEKRLFDAWGAIVKVQDGAGNNLTKLTFIDRGYTGHEHLESVGLINMNARLYDPKLHRFLQADNYIQDLNNTQNYNRYGYCFNNPLKYTDPSGNFIQIGVAIAIGVAVGLATHIITSLAKHQRITLSGVMSTIIISGFSSTATFGIGEVLTGSLGNFYLQASVQALAHGTFQGGMTAIQGGNFWNGFASGSISSVVSSAWSGGVTSEISGNSAEYFKHQGVSGYLGFDNGAGTIFFGTISGGAGAALSGGNFWQGAVTGFVVSALNHDFHKKGDGEKYSYRKQLFKEGKIISEKLVFFKKGKYYRYGELHDDSNLYNSAINEPMINEYLSIYSHGYDGGFNDWNVPDIINENLNKLSLMWRQNRDNGLKIKLTACLTGRITIGGPNISEWLTASYNIEITAPRGLWHYNGNIIDNNNNILSNPWNTFYKGIKK